ncbi:GNAT family N-acetyltransferase [Bombilactobacillus folatiphilus]|uniref:GNAT family N-acetyltransferase n=1 Tax=Bombilactobacillus folatiphilus TaxID=2923362 RepID=A0ABY4P9U6_9LACO|nr:GNAT family N-acetyltransferase [Bombilactobacillus folatiphilus]UQS82513.1 GNAT family N-acetyltransferase [Bombilactobacillus folatiphilus]
MANEHLTLQKMTEKQFQQFCQSQSQEYARQKVSEKLWKADEALSRAQDEFTLLLPDGLQTYHNFFYTIQNIAQKIIGYVWFAEVYDSDQPSKPYAFIYDFVILPAFQDRGLGQQALQLVLQKMQQLGYRQVGLHVFGNNQKARHLYQKLGFVETDVTMKHFM